MRAATRIGVRGRAHSMRNPLYCRFNGKHDGAFAFMAVMNNRADPFYLPRDKTRRTSSCVCSSRRGAVRSDTAPTSAAGGREIFRAIFASSNSVFALATNCVKRTRQRFANARPTIVIVIFILGLQREGKAESFLPFEGTLFPAPPSRSPPACTFRGPHAARVSACPLART